MRKQTGHRTIYPTVWAFLANKSTPAFIHLFENAGSAKKENYVLELKKTNKQCVTVGFFDVALRDLSCVAHCR